MVKIFVVEDHADSREMYGALLAAAGYKPVLFSNPQEALENMGERPRVLLVDNKFGNNPMSGVDFLKRWYEADRSAAVVIVTGSHPDDLMKDLSSLIGDGLKIECLLKPAIDTLVASVGRLAEKRQ